MVIGRSQVFLGFLEGFFDTRGYVKIKNKPEITLWTIYKSHADFIVALLKRAGVRKARIIRRYSPQFRDGVQGVRIRGLQNVKLLADFIHSKVPEKEERLEFLRKKSIPKPEEVRPEIQVFPQMNTGA